MKGGVQRLRVPAFIQGVFVPKELSSSILQFSSRINGTGAKYRNLSAYGNVRNIHSKNSIRFSVLGFCNKHYISVTSPTTLISSISNSRSSVLCRDYRTSAPFFAKKRDYYEVLGVSKGSGKDEVKKKYFELAKKYHPDANKGSKDNEAKFAEISEAYEVLSDDSKKQQYDMFGHQDDQGQGMRGNPFEGFGGFGGGFGGGGGFHGGQGQQIDVEELFNAFGFNVGIRKGANAAATVELSFLEAANGCEKDLKYDYTVKSKDNPRARGTKKSQTLKFKIPAGVIDGMALRVEGKGGEGPAGTPNGDLVITIVVKDDPFFRREGTDIHIDVPITLSQAIMGCTVDVLTLDGMVELKIPAGAQPDARLMMRSKGMRFVSDNMRRGHQICHIKIKIPNSSSLSEQQKTLLLQFEEEENKRVEGTANNTFNFDSALKRVTDFNKSKKE